MDCAAEVYPVKRRLDNDVTKRGGRYQSDFIWNTNWKDKVSYEYPHWCTAPGFDTDTDLHCLLLLLTSCRER